MTLRMLCPTPDQIDANWHHIQPFLSKACSRYGGMGNPALLYNCCKAGSSNYLICADGDKAKAMAVITFQKWGDEMVVYINAAGGGSLKIWRQCQPLFEKWCADRGATSVVYDGSAAYQKLFPKGKPVSTTYRARIK